MHSASGEEDIAGSGNEIYLGYHRINSDVLQIGSGRNTEPESGCKSRCPREHGGNRYNKGT